MLFIARRFVLKYRSFLFRLFKVVGAPARDKTYANESVKSVINLMSTRLKISETNKMIGSNFSSEISKQ